MKLIRRRLTHWVRTEDLRAAVNARTQVRAFCGEMRSTRRPPLSWPHCPECVEALIDQTAADALVEAADRIESGARAGIAKSAKRKKDSARGKRRREVDGHHAAAALGIAQWLRRQAPRLASGEDFEENQ